MLDSEEQVEFSMKMGLWGPSFGGLRIQEF